MRRNGRGKGWGWRGCGGLALALLGFPSPLTEQPNLRGDQVYRVRFIAFPKNRVIPQQGKRASTKREQP
ncbi:MAG TPA: hypothetical protein VKY19_16920 [Ktedonosporobacter sp.]|nr:hypothetical protein [Ktedonosporobacter sp.]